MLFMEWGPEELGIKLPNHLVGGLEHVFFP